MLYEKDLTFFESQTLTEKHYSMKGVRFKDVTFPKHNPFQVNIFASEEIFEEELDNTITITALALENGSFREILTLKRKAKDFLGEGIQFILPGDRTENVGFMLDHELFSQGALTAIGRPRL